MTDLSKVTELSKGRLEYETQVSATAQPMQALHPSNPASSSLPLIQVQLDQRAAAQILQRFRIGPFHSSFPSLFISTAPTNLSQDKTPKQRTET